MTHSPNLTYLTTEQEAARAAYLFDREAEMHLKHTKYRGDFHFIAYQHLTGEGDYTPADEGMHWSDSH